MRRGFTLVELLVAISIITILSTIGLAIFSNIQSKARDSIRKKDLNSLATALEIYFQKNDKYVGEPKDDGSCDTTSMNLNSDTFKQYLNNAIPIDPQTHKSYLYTAEKKCQSYRLFATLENCNGSGGNLCEFTNYNYTVVSDDLTIAAASGDTAP